MSYVLYDHQKTILGLFTENPKFLLLAEVGTGKTLPTVVHMSNLYIGGEIGNALVVAPLSGLGAWYRSVKMLPEDRQSAIWKNTTFINYDKLSRKGGKYQKLCNKPWDLIVLDEGHAISNPSSNRTKYFVGSGKKLGLAEHAKYAYLLTGTLLTNSRLENLWAPLRFILGNLWMTWADFKRRYLVMRNLPASYAEIVVGYRNKDELLGVVADYSYRVLKRDCLDLPKALPDEIVEVPLDTKKNKEPFGKSTEQLYAEALESYVDALDMVMDNPLTRMLRLRQIATGHIKEADTCDETGKTITGTTYTLNSFKTKYAMELIESKLPEKMVVFYHFTETCRRLEVELRKAKIKYVTLNGEQKNKLIWEDFQEDESIKVILVQYTSGSVAIDLFAANHTLYMEPTDSSYLMDQSRARTDRNGQTVACNYTFLLTKGTIEMDMYESLQNHEDFHEKTYREIARKRVRNTSC